MNNFLKAIMAGVAIAIGGIVNLSVGGIAGAVLFSVGLMAVCIFEYSLFTGKVCYLSDSLISTLIGNILGAIAVGSLIALTNTRVMVAAQNVCEQKLQAGWKALPLGILCGILIFWAVDSYRKDKRVVMLITCVAVFVLSGFEHCIANAFYFAAGGFLRDINAWMFLLLNIAGNAIGGILAHMLTYNIKERKDV